MGNIFDCLTDKNEVDKIEIMNQKFERLLRQNESLLRQNESLLRQNETNKLLSDFNIEETQDINTRVYHLNATFQEKFHDTKELLRELKTQNDALKTQNDSMYEYVVTFPTYTNSGGGGLKKSHANKSGNKGGGHRN
jgi:hypothetical protein